MKPIYQLIISLSIAGLLSTGTLHSSTESHFKGNITKRTDLFSYTFKVDGIDSYGYKPFIDFIQNLFQKRPVYYPETGKFSNEEGLFEIIGTPANITELHFSTKLAEIGLTLVQFNGVNVTEADHHQNK